MDKWQELRKYFVKQANELEEDDDYSIFALEVLDVMDSIEEKERLELKNNEQNTV